MYLQQLKAKYSKIQAGLDEYAKKVLEGYLEAMFWAEKPEDDEEFQKEYPDVDLDDVWDGISSDTNSSLVRHPR